MTFLVDAQLPRKLAVEIRSLGGHALHTLDLAERNRTQDAEIIGRSVESDWIVVTKDSDFVDSFLLKGKPPKLVFISTGNITNSELLGLFRSKWSSILKMLEEGSFVELTRTSLILHC